MFSVSVSRMTTCVLCSGIFRLLVALMLLNGFPVAAQGPGDSLEQAEERAFREAALLASPSIVRIDTVGGLDTIGEVIAGTASTTGVVVSPDGEIVTSAFNFISKPASVLVTLPDGKRYPARIVATDLVRSITLLRIAAQGLTPAKPADPASVRVGQWSIALGRTYDSASPSISVGIVSAVKRIWGLATQTDAKISPVNYGGPLVDLDSRVLGILTPLAQEANDATAGVEWYDSGIGFAIPLTDILAELPRLREGRDLRPGRTGLSFKTKDLYADPPKVDRVWFDSPAWNAGLRPGDVVEKVNGQAVGSMMQFMHQIKSRIEGDVLDVAFKRGDQTQSAKLTLVAELKPYEIPFLGVLPARNAVKGQPGVEARYVYPDSPAQKAGLQSRDRLLTLNGEILTDAKQLADRVGRLRLDEDVKLEVRRADQTLPLTLKPGRLPNAIPAELATSPSTGDPQAGLKTGRITGQLPGDDREYWAWVPESYRPDSPMSLLVWVHGPGSTFEAEVLREWKTHCDLRGIILLGPRQTSGGRWTPADADYVHSLVTEFQKTYRVAPERIAVHGSGPGAGFAAHLAFRHRDTFRALLIAGAPIREQPPEPSPDQRLQLHFICGEKDPVLPFVQKTVQQLEKLKLPTSLRTVPNTGGGYPSGESLEEAARWIDSLDRI